MRSKYIGILGLSMLGFMVLVAIFAPLIAPYFLHQKKS